MKYAEMTNLQLVESMENLGQKCVNLESKGPNINSDEYFALLAEFEDLKAEWRHRTTSLNEFERLDPKRRRH